MRFRKSTGLTASEKVLADLCEKSFLNLWTYPNLYKKPAKELADLLVVWQDHVIIFSDKSCAYPDTGAPDLDWARWHRRAISNSAHQIAQTVRWLKTCPDKIFLDAKCDDPLPIRFPASPRFHRICVTTGAAPRCLAATGSSSLAIDRTISGDERPFAYNPLEGADAVHIFDEAALALVLGELNTATDFVQYLEARTALFHTDQFKGAPSEADLLAYFLWNNRSFPQKAEPYVLESGLWQRIETDRGFLAGRRENQISAFWDGLIEYVTTHYLESTLELGNEVEMSDYERLARVLASEHRFHRRLLSKAILERAELAREGRVRSLLPSSQANVVYALLIGPGASRNEYAAYRTSRTQELSLRCVAAKAVHPNTHFVVGIAMDARGADGGSEDFILLDTTEWTPEDQARAERVRGELGYYVGGRATETRMVEDEYPTGRGGL